MNSMARLPNETATAVAARRVIAGRAADYERLAQSSVGARFARQLAARILHEDRDLCCRAERDALAQRMALPDHATPRAGVSLPLRPHARRPRSGRVRVSIHAAQIALVAREAPAALRQAALFGTVREMYFLMAPARCWFWRANRASGREADSGGSVWSPARSSTSKRLSWIRLARGLFVAGGKA